MIWWYDKLVVGFSTGKYHALNIKLGPSPGFILLSHQVQGLECGNWTVIPSNIPMLHYTKNIKYYVSYRLVIVSQIAYGIYSHNAYHWMNSSISFSLNTQSFSKEKLN